MQNKYWYSKKFQLASTANISKIISVLYVGVFLINVGVKMVTKTFYCQCDFNVYGKQATYMV